MFCQSTIITRLLLMSTILLTYCKFGGKTINRFVVPKDKKSWTIEWSQYKPTLFEVDFEGKDWADPSIDDPNFKPKWNSMDGKVDRRSHQGLYQVLNGYPLNPLGRTGVKLRGLLGRWGPNHAADPIVTRWKRNQNNEIIKDSITNSPILQFVSIQRRDTNEWAIPGGMVDAGEHVSATVKREFFEEALNSLELDKERKDDIENKLNNFFSNGVEIYRGCVDDPRNTDNAWMETVAFNFHDESGEVIGNIDLNAGDDALNVRWIDINKSLKLYANHLEFIMKTANRLSAHW